MEVLLELGQLKQAEKLAMNHRKVVSSMRTDFEESLLSCGLGEFFARTHQWEHALTAWQHIPPDTSIARNVLRGVAEIHLARAFEAVESGLRLLADRKVQLSELDFCVLNLEFDLVVDAEKELLKFKRGIEKLLPEETHKELGMSQSASAIAKEDRAQ